MIGQYRVAVVLDRQDEFFNYNNDETLPPKSGSSCFIGCFNQTDPIGDNPLRNPAFYKKYPGVDEDKCKEILAEKKFAREWVTRESHDWFLFDEIKRVDGNTKEDMEFKQWQKDFVEGNKSSKELFDWLKAHITFVDETTDKYIEKLKKNDEISDYHILLPFNKLVDR